ncbi:MAG: aminotransferase class V-fold PLP-dependent enzyme, partial [Alphaproteobacteria bacterium]|nr:aminotransferase class V-fold PLP-dependent enzyme [Alphaproteobacteria bacterium]
ARATYVDNMLDDVRCRVASFMNAWSDNIVFTSGTTDAFNRIVKIINLNSYSVVAVSDLDHHSARIPFEMSGAKTVVCPLDDNLNIDVDNIPYADVFVITAMSNVLGMPQDIVKIINAARQKNPNVITIVDAAQFVVHESIDVKKWDADFVVWSGHKIGSDTGVGVMYIKNPNRFRIDKFGGGMVKSVSPDGKISFVSVPGVFEAGTLPLTQIAGLGVAVDEIEKNRPDLNLIKYLYDELKKIERVKIITSRDAAMLSFVIDGMHVLDFGALVGAYNICIRVGNMCASWIHHMLNIDGSIRVSVGAYNTLDDIKGFLDVARGIIK